MSPSPPTPDRRHDGVVLWHRIDAVEAGTRQVGLGVDGVLALGAVAHPVAVEVGAEVLSLLIWTGPGDADVDRDAIVVLPTSGDPGWPPEISSPSRSPATASCWRRRATPPMRRDR